MLIGKNNSITKVRSRHAVKPRAVQPVVIRTPTLGRLVEMKKKIIIFLLLIFSLFIPFLGFEIVNTNSFSEFKNFYSFFWIGFSYIILLLISAILILKSKNKLFYKISFILIDCVYIFFTVFLIKILIP